MLGVAVMVAMVPVGLACTGCMFDTTGCTAVCGNGVQETGEACDDGGTNICGPCNATCSGAKQLHQYPEFL